VREALRVEVEEPGAVVVAHGRLDSSSADQLRTALHECIAAGDGDLLVRAEGLEIWGSSAIGLLIGASRAARRRDRRLVITGLAPREQRLLRASHLQRLMFFEPAAGMDVASAPRDVQPA
jgi:anti-sigma B factor antagonist